MYKYLIKYIALVFIFFTSIANAEVEIDINAGNVEPVSIALPAPAASAGYEKELSNDVVSLVANDLRSTGLFNPIDPSSFIQKIDSSQTIPQFEDWKILDASALFVGDLKFVNPNEFNVEYRLWDIFAQKQLVGKRYTTHKDNWRRISHLIADQIYNRITGEAGYFDTRIVYVGESGPAKKRIKRLAIMDLDGANHRYLTDGSDLVLTPRFSPTAQDILYLSYKSGQPKVYERNVDTGKEKLIGTFPGMTFAPRYSPDGKSVIMSAASRGSSNIYSYDLRSKKQTQVTNSRAIDTSPSYSPDGKRVTFNSDRGGSQQIYVMNADGSDVRRISFGDGNYGTPVWSPRGDYIAFTKIKGGRFYIGVMHPDGTKERLLTESFLDEGPTWSPNGRIIIFARQTRIDSINSKWNIYSVDITGRNERLISTPTDASDPAWSSTL